MSGKDDDSGKEAAAAVAAERPNPATEGQRAFDAGQDRGSNPFPPASEEYTAWDGAFDAAAVAKSKQEATAVVKGAKRTPKAPKPKRAAKPAPPGGVAALGGRSVAGSRPAPKPAPKAPLKPAQAAGKASSKAKPAPKPVKPAPKPLKKGRK